MKFIKTRNSSQNKTEVIEFEGGEKLSLQIPAVSPNCQKRMFAFSLHKSGSTLMTKMLKQYLGLIGAAYLDLPGAVFTEGLLLNKIITSSVAGIFERSGICFLGWRNFPGCLNDVNFTSSKNILLVRDPRDRIVSSYFSLSKSHIIPQKGAGKNVLSKERERVLNADVDTFAKERIGWISGPMNIYHRYLPAISTRIYRYEDVIFRKKEWLEDMIYYLELPINENIIDKVAKENDILPDAENPEAHIRQVKPGNYKKYLSNRVLKDIESSLSQIFKKYDYHNSEQFGHRLIFAKEGIEARQILNL